MQFEAYYCLWNFTVDEINSWNPADIYFAGEIFERCMFWLAGIACTCIGVIITADELTLYLWWMSACAFESCSVWWTLFPGHSYYPRFAFWPGRPDLQNILRGGKGHFCGLDYGMSRLTRGWYLNHICKGQHQCGLGLPVPCIKLFHLIAVFSHCIAAGEVTTTNFTIHVTRWTAQYVNPP